MRLKAGIFGNPKRERATPLSPPGKISPESALGHALTHCASKATVFLLKLSA
jgi:hypothetical protein